MYKVFLIVFILYLVSIVLDMLYYTISESERKIQEKLNFDRKMQVKLNLNNVKKIRYEKENGKIVKKIYKQ